MTLGGVRGAPGLRADPQVFFLSFFTRPLLFSSVSNPLPHFLCELHILKHNVKVQEAIEPHP